MNRDHAYGILANRLEQFRSFGYDALLPLVNEPAVSETVRVNGEDVVVDIAVLWKDKKRRTLLIWHGVRSEHVDDAAPRREDRGTSRATHKCTRIATNQS